MASGRGLGNDAGKSADAGARCLTDCKQGCFLELAGARAPRAGGSFRGRSKEESKRREASHHQGGRVPGRACCAWSVQPER